MKEEVFTPGESLALIQSMIDKAKANLQDNSFYFLIWGWVVFIAALSHFILMKFTSFAQPWLTWNLIWIGVIATIVKGIRQDRQEKVKTWLGDTMKFFGISLGILFMGLAFVFGTQGLWIYSYPIYILVYAVACFFMGSIMQFNLLKVTGLLCLPLVVVSVFLSYDWQLLLLALAVLISYIIPGHVLYKGYHRKKTLDGK